MFAKEARNVSTMSACAVSSSAALLFGSPAAATRVEGKERERWGKGGGRGAQARLERFWVLS